MGLSDFIKEVNSTVQFNNNNSPINTQEFKNNGFLVPASYTADKNGLPYSKVPPNRQAQIKRNIITWLVPQIGAIKMYVNPTGIGYIFNKIINTTRTKGGYSLQYWGEEMPSLNIRGTTGSSGVEGINMLYEIYRAEQYSFDSVGLMIANNNASADIVNNLTNYVGNNVFGDSNGIASQTLSGVLGLGSAHNISSGNIPNLASSAFTVEMYYGGWVFRGFFKSFSFNENAENFLLDYNITFTVTQKRGYRTNYLPFHKSANSGYSLYNTPNSLSGNVTEVQNNGIGVSPDLVAR